MTLIRDEISHVFLNLAIHILNSVIYAKLFFLDYYLLVRKINERSGRESIWSSNKSLYSLGIRYKI